MMNYRADFPILDTKVHDKKLIYFRIPQCF